MTRTIPGGSPGGVIGGVVGGVGGPPASPLALAAKAENRSSSASFSPRWTLERAANGLTQVTVLAPREALLLLVKRGAGGVEVVSLQRQGEDGDDGAPRRAQVRLGPGDVLDLYRLNHPVADPSKLPETGPVDGFRARIYPAK